MTWKKAKPIPADEVFRLCHLPVISLVRLRLLFQGLKGLPVQFQSFENRRNHGTRLKVPLFRCGAGSDRSLQQDTYISRSRILTPVIPQ